MDFLQIGPATVNSSIPGLTATPLRGSNMGALIVDELYGPKYEAAYRGATYWGANQAVVSTALQTGLTATATGGLILSNPLGNTKNLVVRTASIGVLVAQTNASIMGLMIASSPSVAIGGTLTVVASQNTLPLSGGAATGILYSSASVTLQSTPILAKVIGSLGTGALTTGIQTGIVADLGGGLVLQPGSALAFYGTGVGTASSLLFSYEWNEVPI